MKLRIETSVPGKEKLYLDDENIGARLRVSHAQVVLSAGEHPQVVLTCLPDEIELNGEIPVEGVSCEINGQRYRLVCEEAIQAEERNRLLDEFIGLVQAHDVTYQYSDDGVVFRRGRQQRQEIIDLSNRIGREHCVPVWNYLMQEKFGANADEFMWSLADNTQPVAESLP